MPIMRFVLDENVPHLLASLLRSLGYDADSAKELGRLGLSDPEVLRRAATDGRALVTVNGRDFRMLHEAWIAWRRRWEDEVVRLCAAPLALSRHAGILIVPQRTTHELAAILDDFAASAGSLEDRLFVWHAARGWLEPLPLQP